MFERALSIPRVISMLGDEHAKVANMKQLHRVLLNCTLKIHGILNVLSSELDRVMSIP